MKYNYSCSCSVIKIIGLTMDNYNMIIKCVMKLSGSKTPLPRLL